MLPRFCSEQQPQPSLDIDQTSLKTAPPSSTCSSIRNFVSIFPDPPQYCICLSTNFVWWKEIAYKSSANVARIVSYPALGSCSSLPIKFDVFVMHKLNFYCDQKNTMYKSVIFLSAPVEELLFRLVSCDFKRHSGWSLPLFNEMFIVIGQSHILYGPAARALLVTIFRNHLLVMQCVI